MTGRSADALVINVPPGTLVYDAESGDLLGDLTDRDQELMVCKGGRGGRGNIHFVSARHRITSYNVCYTKLLRVSVGKYPFP